MRSIGFASLRAIRVLRVLQAAYSRSRVSPALDRRWGRIGRAVPVTRSAPARVVHCRPKFASSLSPPARPRPPRCRRPSHLRRTRRPAARVRGRRRTRSRPRGRQPRCRRGRFRWMQDRGRFQSREGTATHLPGRTIMSDEDLKAEVERLRRENEALKQRTVRGVSLKVSEKGGVSVYGLGRFPITLYQEQWTKLLDMADQIRAFITEHKSELKKKE